MKKGLFLSLVFGVVIMMGVGVFMIGLGSALTCDVQGFRYRSYHCYNSNCNNCNEQTASTSCYQNTQSTSCVNRPGAPYDDNANWRTKNSQGACTKTWTCSDSWVNPAEYQCSGNNRERKKTVRTCGSWDNCISNFQWFFVETCTYGCSGAGVCNTCAPQWEIIEPKNYTCSDGTRSMILKNDTNCGTGVQFFEYENCFPNQCVEETGRCSTLDTTYWANLHTGQEINETNIGATVLMVFGGENLGGQNITFQVSKFEDNSFRLFEPSTWPNIFRRSNWGQIGFISSENNYEALNLEDVSIEDILNFNATINGSSVSSSSSNLTITGSSNFLPIANITFPEKATNELNFQTFAVDQDIEFTQASYDEDDLLKLTWNFGDGNNRTLYNYSRALNSSGGDTIYRYNGSNTEVGGKFYTVTLTAEEMTRTQVSEPDSVQIYVFKKGVNVVPIITSPRLREGGYFLHFNASQSYVVNCSEGAMEPARGIPVGNFNCTYLLAPGRTDLEPDVLGEVRIRWSEVNNFVNRSVIEGGWFTKNEQAGVVWNSTNYNSSVTFSILDPRPTLRKIVMEMNYNATAA
jgi:hypothetical protein